MHIIAGSLWPRIHFKRFSSGCLSAPDATMSWRITAEVLVETFIHMFNVTLNSSLAVHSNLASQNQPNLNLLSGKAVPRK